MLLYNVEVTNGAERRVGLCVLNRLSRGGGVKERFPGVTAAEGKRITGRGRKT